MKNKKIMSLALVLAGVLVIGGCGSSGSSDSSYANSKAASGMMTESATDEMYFDDAYDYESAEAAEGSSTASIEVNDTSRKLIKDVSLSVETEEYDKLVDNVTARVNALGGYIEDSYSYNGSNYSGSSELRYGNMTIRIPANKLDEFLSKVAEISNITSKNYSVKDVTLEYVDVEARKDSLKTQHDRLLELMENAESVEDIIALESRLSDLEYELDSAERQIRTYDNKVDYSTVRMEIAEVEKYTPKPPKNRWQEMGEGFMDSLADATDNVLDLFIGLIVILPHLVVFGIFVLIVVLIVKAIIKSSKKKKAEKMKAYMPGPFPNAPAPAAPQVQNPVPQQNEQAKEQSK